jgi:starvation-inducible DNA-binding protein
MVTATRTGASVIDCLTHAQANAITMYLNNKRYHWFTYGPHFRDLHLFFDEMANSAFAEVDPLGERIRMLRGDPVSTPAQINRWTTITVANGTPPARQMLEEALQNERCIVDEMRTGARLAEEEGDYGTNDFFATFVQNHEKYSWFIDLRTGDGLGGR